MKKAIIIFSLLITFSCQKELIENRKEDLTEEFESKDQFTFDVPIETETSKKGKCVRVEVTCSDLYLNTYSNGRLISSVYLYRECEKIMVGDCGRTGGGSGPTKEKEALILELKSPCPESFKFGTIVSSDKDGGGWQEAGVYGIHFNVISTHKSVKSRMVKLPTVYFGMPISRINGDFYSPSVAAQNAAKAVKKAETEAVYYGRTNPGVSDERVAAYWLERINYWMGSWYSGSATKQPASNVNPTKPPTQAKEGC